MVVSGCPLRNGNKHAFEIACMALDLVKQIHKIIIPQQPLTPLSLRIGLHSGN